MKSSAPSLRLKNAATAPAFPSAVRLSGFLSKTTHSWPPLSSLSTMPDPMRPAPTIPNFISMRPAPVPLESECEIIVFVAGDACCHVDLVAEQGLGGQVSHGAEAA